MAIGRHGKVDERTNVIEANIPWYTAYIKSGMDELATLGAASTFLKPIF